MDVVIGIVVLLALIGGGMWLWEKIQDLFFGATDSIAGFLDGSSRSRSKKVKSESHTTPTLQILPEPREAHDTLEAFCRIMHKIDVAMSPYCQYEGQARLTGGVGSDGRGYVLFWYDKDYGGVESVFHEIGYYSPSENSSTSSATTGSNAGWTIDNGMIQYRSRAITGYLEWTGYNTTYKQFGKDAAENSMRRMIEAVLQNEWPEARITSYSGYFDAPSGESVAYSIQVKTVIGG